jgi:hypothetical protein
LAATLLSALLSALASRLLLLLAGLLLTAAAALLLAGLLLAAALLLAALLLLTTLALILVSHEILLREDSRGPRTRLAKVSSCVLQTCVRLLAPRICKRIVRDEKLSIQASSSCNNNGV